MTFYSCNFKQIWYDLLLTHDDQWEPYKANNNLLDL